MENDRNNKRRNTEKIMKENTHKRQTAKDTRIKKREIGHNVYRKKNCV